MTRLRWGLPGLLLWGCVRCTSVLQGPPENLQAVVAPDPVREVLPSRPPSLSPSGPSVSPGSFRAWEVPSVTREGDRTEGRWVTISDTPPAVEKIEWDKTIPRPPHTLRPAKSVKPAPAVAQPQARPAPPPTPWVHGVAPGSLPGLVPGMPEALPGLPSGAVPLLGDR